MEASQDGISGFQHVPRVVVCDNSVNNPTEASVRKLVQGEEFLIV
jgi:hypothetical protein